MTTRTYLIKVLGRTLEHLGVQMYKRRDTAIAELVANCWDAGARNVWISLPLDGYDPSSSLIVLEDDGAGMDPDAVQDHYLVVGRNRRRDEDPPPDRPVMGRKGIGKLAGFGIARTMELSTWRDGVGTMVTLDVDALKTEAGEVSDVELPGEVAGVPDGARASSGTRIVLRGLKHASPLSSEVLRLSLARRFSRRVRGVMEVHVNDQALGEPDVKWEGSEPNVIEADLDDGNRVRYFAGFSKTVLTREMRGFTVMVAGKTAHAPPFYFDVEGTASGQHGTRYLHGWVEADYLDEGTDDEGDIVSTDRQEIDWEAPTARILHEWGAELTRRLLREWANRRAEATRKNIYENKELSDRIGRLDKSSRKQVDQFLGRLGLAEATNERTLELASALVRAYEYRHFHDVTSEIEAASNDPDQLQTLLSHLADWKVLESRAILEIIQGRLQIIETFREMVIADTPETAPRVGANNLHDLLARYPWLIDTDWQTLEEEKATTTQLRQWGFADEDPGEVRRFDFLALEGPDLLVVIEIKRPGHSVSLEERQRVEKYVRDLRRAKPAVRGVLISGGSYEFDPQEQSSSIELQDWAAVYERTRRYYQHYRDVLIGEIETGAFASKEREVRNTREVLDRGAYRGRSARRLGDQDVEYPQAEEESGG